MIHLDITTNYLLTILQKLQFILMFGLHFFITGLTQNITKVGVIHELPLRNNQGCSYILRK
ncbi:MAG: hypothetical protein ACLBM6_02855, partial [Cuspidothrix sp.]